MKNRVIGLVKLQRPQMRQIHDFWKGHIITANEIICEIDKNIENLEKTLKDARDHIDTMELFQEMGEEDYEDKLYELREATNIEIRKRDNMEN